MYAGTAVLYAGVVGEHAARTAFVAASLLVGFASAAVYAWRPSRGVATGVGFACGLCGVTGYFGILSIGILVLLACGAGFLAVLMHPRPLLPLALAVAGVPVALLGYFLTAPAGEHLFGG